MKKLLTVIQASELLEIHRISLYKLIYARKIPHIRKEGVGLRFDPDQLEVWAKQGEVEASGHSKKEDIKISGRRQHEKRKSQNPRTQ